MKWFWRYLKKEIDKSMREGVINAKNISRGIFN